MAGFSLSSITGGAGGGLASDAVRLARNNSPSVQENRERLAVVVHDGLGWYEKYISLKPTIFAMSLASAGVNGFMAYRRFKQARAKQASWEAVTLYGLLTVMSLGAAWVTRPGSSSSAAAAKAPDTPEAKAGFAMLGYLDERRRELAAQDPRWADKTLQKFVSTPGLDSYFKSVDPVILALLV